MMKQNRILEKRFMRQISLPGFGLQGQQKLLESSALILGLGAVGSICAVYLTRAGIGRLGLADHDYIEEHNLHRQVIYDEDDENKGKVEVLCKRLQKGNSSICLEPYVTRVDAKFLQKTIDRYDVIVDAVDNFETKLSINDCCVASGKPFVFGGVAEYLGQVLSVIPGRSPCLRCLVSEAPRETNTSPLPVFAPVPGVVGCIQASEVMKMLLGIGNPLIGRFLTFDARDWSYSIIPFAQRKGCNACGDATFRKSYYKRFDNISRGE